MRFGAAVIFTALTVLLPSDRLYAGNGTDDPLVSAPIAVNAAAFSESVPDIAMRTRADAAFLSPTSNAVAGFGELDAESRSDHSPDFSRRDRSGLAAVFSSIRMPDPLLSFPGLSNLDNALEFSLLIIPPDMNGDVGPDHYVQAVNSLFRVFDKNGNPLTPPIRLSSLFTSLGTPCSTRNDGLPIVLYDQLADRWLISQICTAFPPFRQLIAVSKTGDPAGGYFAYEFAMPNVRQNDFPKFGVWTDAYYMANDEFFGSDYYGSGMFAFDRRKMIAGDPTAGYVYFSMPSNVQIRRKGMLPADLDGLRPPPAGSPGIFASYTADEYGDAADTIRLFEFRANFSDHSASSFRETDESPITVPEVDPTSPEGRADIAQPPPGEFLDSQSDRINYRLAYRNLDSYQSLVVNQTARMTPAGATYRAGVRVYELRNSGSGFTPHVASTIGDETASRWIGAVAQDHEGNLAVQYNFVSEEKKPSILYSGRLANDPANTFRSEATLIEGTGVQKAFGFRWGDYGGMTVDPADDCTFWLTNSYYSAESQQWSDLGWLTRIGSFRFAECTAAPRGRLAGTVTSSAGGLAIAGAAVEIFAASEPDSAAFIRYTDAAGNIPSIMLPPGSYRVSAKARGYRPSTADVTVGKDLDVATVVDLQLDPVPLLSISGVTFTAESCRIDRSPNPGESLSMNVTIANDGNLAAKGLSAVLLPVGGVNLPGPPQYLGTLDAGERVTRSFLFTVSGSAVCGSLITPTFRVSADGQPEIDLTSSHRVGTEKVAFAENFDSVATPALPAGWSTSATENHQLWRTSSARSQTADNSAFSPAPLQRGVNELVSPVFKIKSAAARLSFRNWYELETTFLRNRLYDGSVLEIKIGSGDWHDIIAAGGQFLAGGYDGTIDSCCSNPLGGRLGWSGRSGIDQQSVFIDTNVKLPAAAAGEMAQLRWRIGTDIGGFREGQYLDNIVVTDGYTCECRSIGTRAQFDFDGDGRTDIGTVSLSDSIVADFKVIMSSTNAVAETVFGSLGDVPAVADFDGDQKADVAVFRPQAGEWWIIRSSDTTVEVGTFGVAGDRPLPADYDGDGKADRAIYRPSSGNWYVLQSSDGFISARHFGISTDVPLASDHDGDGRTDLAVYRRNSGEWWVLRSGTESVTVTRFGLADDIPVTADFDGDGRADLGVFRASLGMWYILQSAEGFIAARFGLPGDVPLQGDFDGDGKADIGVYRPGNGTWYTLLSSTGQASARAYGSETDIPIPSIYLLR